VKCVAGTRHAAESNSAGWSDGIDLAANQAQAIGAKRTQIFAGGRRRAVEVSSRGDWTPLELFLAGARDWDRPEDDLTATIGRRQLDVQMTGLERIRELAKRKHRK
jgi:hypothetical protein